MALVTLAEQRKSEMGKRDIRRTGSVLAKLPNFPLHQPGAIDVVLC